MISLAVHKNDQLVCRAGIANAIMITAHLSAYVAAEQPCELHVAGMCSLDQDRDAHVRWIEQLIIAAGDRVTFRLSDKGVPTRYASLVATDAPEYLREQDWFAQQERDYRPPQRPAQRRWPHVRWTHFVDGVQQVRAAYSLQDEHILCSLLWDQWRPDRLRVHTRSFPSAGATPSSRQTDWLQQLLLPDQTFAIAVDA